MPLSRREFLKNTGAFGALAGLGLLTPDDEPVNRFWRGWTRTRIAEVHQRPPIIGDPVFEVAYDTTLVSPAFLAHLRPFDVVVVDPSGPNREMMWFDGKRLVRGQAGTEISHHEPWAPAELLGLSVPDDGVFPLEPLRRSPEPPRARRFAWNPDGPLTPKFFD